MHKLLCCTHQDLYKEGEKEHLSLLLDSVLEIPQFKQYFDKVEGVLRGIGGCWNGSELNKNMICLYSHDYAIVTCLLDMGWKMRPVGFGRAEITNPTVPNLKAIKAEGAVFFVLKD